MLTQLDFRDKMQLVQYLLECPALATPGARSSTINELPSPVKNQYLSAVLSSPLDEVLALVNTCAQFPYPEGLGRLVEIIRLRDKGTVALTQLERFLSKLSKPAASPTIVPSVPTHLPVVYIAYSDTDEKWLRQLQNNLHVIEESSKVQLWDRTKIRAGEKWLEKTTDALYRAKVAILLVSTDFFRQEKTRGWELPSIMEAYRSRNLQLIPIIATPCLYEHNILSDIVPIKETALSELSPSKRVKIWRETLGRVQELL
jgi:hypothetical protein